MLSCFQDTIFLLSEMKNVHTITDDDNSSISVYIGCSKSPVEGEI